jgi:L-lactate dehydrogenase complex protein LldE
MNHLKISLFIPCYVDQLSPHVAIAMIEVLERLGHTVDYPSGQTCCGQPAFNSGYFDEARQVAEHFLKTFHDTDLIAVPSGSCAAMVRKFYPEIFEKSNQLDEAKEIASKTFEFSELLVDRLGVEDVGASLAGTATYHDGCHGLRELGIKDAPRKLLSNVSGLELIEMDEAQSCCGFGGTFAVKFPQISTAMTQVKLGSAKKTEASYLISGDPSCLMQINGYFKRQKADIQCLHIAEVLAKQ